MNNFTSNGSNLTNLCIYRRDYYCLTPFALGEIRNPLHDAILLDLIEGKLEVEDKAIPQKLPNQLSRERYKNTGKNKESGRIHKSNGQHHP